MRRGDVGVGVKADGEDHRRADAGAGPTNHLTGLEVQHHGLAGGGVDQAGRGAVSADAEHVADRGHGIGAVGAVGDVELTGETDGGVERQVALVLARCKTDFSPCAAIAAFLDVLGNFWVSPD